MCGLADVAVCVEVVDLSGERLAAVVCTELD
jgi:hypothetical protein